MPYEITLQKLLETNDKGLFGRLIGISDIGRTLLSYTQGAFPYYTPHDFHHSVTVEENLNWIIPDSIKESLNIYEIFFLICAAWLHDWGMIGKKGEDANEIRENHHIRTEAYLESMHDKVGLSLHEGRIVGRICKGHRKVDLHSLEYEDMIIGQSKRIRTRFLSALLRIADETDITHSRTPEVIYYTLNPSGTSEEEFKKHLNISGIGQLDEPYKIYITGIARDPKGAQTLREVESKIQRELDTVKSILSHNGLFLDIVELRMETRGFIDKPIAFEVNKNKIVDLLIGKHLYGKVDVAIRELVQNSIDTCNLRSLFDSEYSPQIILGRENTHRLIVSDNGTGMGFTEAKRFLSNVGSSFYQSDDFKQALKDKAYNPISHFGIGLLSSFLIADGIEIETMKKGEEPCKFTISSLSENWKYEKGSLKKPGTVITLVLNSVGKKISILESLNRYFVSTNVPISYKEIDNDFKIFCSKWSIETILNRFIEDDVRFSTKSAKQVVEVNSSDYDSFLVRTSNYFNKQLILFNHGVFVNSFDIDGMSNRYCLFVNIKSDLIDIQISRENVIKNERWHLFLHLLFNNILCTIRDSVFRKDLGSFVSIMSDIIDRRSNVDKLKYDDLLEKYPFIHSVINVAPFPVVTGKAFSWATLSQIPRMPNMDLYKCTSMEYKKEVTIYSKIRIGKKAFFNPYDLPYVGRAWLADESLDLIEHIFKLHNKPLNQIDLRTLLVSISKPVKISYSKILPKNVKLCSFGNLKPLIVVLKKPKVFEKEAFFGQSYWGNILLWHKLTEKDRHSTYIKCLNEYSGDRFESIKLIEEHIVLIDSTDPFISDILRRYEALKSAECQVLQRYFKYLSYLPLVVHNMESCLIFLNVLDNIEKELSELLSLHRPVELFTRMKPDSSVYLQYLKKCGLSYVET